MWAASTVAAAALVAPSSPLDYLTQYGPLGFMVLAFIVGWIVPGPVAKQKDAEIARLQKLYEEEIFPISRQYAVQLDETTRVLEKALEALRHDHGGGSR